jgi:hypothetical protein
MADGQLVYAEIASGEKVGFQEFRRDPELKPFLSAFVDKDFIDPLQATRAMKKLIRIISEKQDLVKTGGVDVGPESDCFLLATGGARDMNAEMAEAEALAAKKPALMWSRFSGHKKGLFLDRRRH